LSGLQEAAKHRQKFVKNIAISKACELPITGNESKFSSLYLSVYIVLQSQFHESKEHFFIY